MARNARHKMPFCSKRILGAGLGLVLGASTAQAQFRPDYWEMQAEAERQRAEQARALEREQYEAMLAQHSARAHARMEEEGAFSAGLNKTVDWQAAHPNVFGSGQSLYTNYTYVTPPQRYTPWSRLGSDFPIWQDVAPDDEPTESLFSEYISQQIVQAKCVTCHVEGGVSGEGISRLQFSPSTVEDHVNLNRAVFENFVATVDEPVDLILNKVQGVAHGGGIQLTAGTADFANLERFLRQLADESSTGSSTVTAENLFEGVTMASPARTLRRAAILFAGRLPTQAELDAVTDGEEATLRSTIRGLMSGGGFHEFLITASNDRLLTDRHLELGLGVVTLDSQLFVELNRKYAEVLRAAISRGYEYYGQDPAYHSWERSLVDGLARAPLELIAHVVENDMPYTEVLTADYIMANPMAAEAYGATAIFNNDNDRDEFKPSKIVSYYRNDDSKTFEYDPTINVSVVASPGNLSTDYPHAGVLNTTAFLKRYPSTATNRNRARSRWTYYHFLGLDVEKSASRTTDPDALADRNNPTLNNPACTVCHAVLDPVGGAFQNYGDDGLYRDQTGGFDSLPNLYKNPEDGSTSPYRQGDTWYRDMRLPGFGNDVAPDASNSVQWLAQKIVADNRFAEAAVQFWWPAIMGVELLDPPEDSGDPNFQGRLVAATAQAAEVTRLGDTFRAGIDGGTAHNGKDLLAEIALSPWFRAESVTGQDPVRAVALRDAGAARLLTPQELNRKTDAVAGYVWGRDFYRTMDFGRGQALSNLDNEVNWKSNYGLLYGGINSNGITTRATDMTPVMAGVGQSHAAEVSCPIVRREFYFWEDEDRLLFDGIDRFDTPVSESYGRFEVSADTWDTRQTFTVEVPLTAGDKTLRIGFENDFYDDENDQDRNLNVDRVQLRDSSGSMVTAIELEHLGSGCGSPRDHFDSFYTFWDDNCRLEIPVEVLHDDIYQIDIVAHQDRAGGDAARMTVIVESDDGASAGATAIRNKLVDLHRKLFGVKVAADSPDVDRAFQVFFEVWARKHRTEGGHFDHSEFQCAAQDDHAYYDGLVDDPVEYGEWGGSRVNWDRASELFDKRDMSDPTHAVRTWVVTLAYLMTDYRYLYLF